MNKFRTHNCAELGEKDLNKEVIISGWLHRRRDHGNLIFIDIRDHYGITQCVTENNNKFFSILEKKIINIIILDENKINDTVISKLNKNECIIIDNYKNKIDEK